MDHKKSGEVVTEGKLFQHNLTTLSVLQDLATRAGMKLLEADGVSDTIGGHEQSEKEVREIVATRFQTKFGTV